MIPATHAHTGQIVASIEDRIAALEAARAETTEPDNSHRAARVLAAILPAYADDPAAAIRDALTDLRHACDLIGLTYADEDRAAHRAYVAEIVAHGPAPHILEGWTDPTEGEA